MSVKEMIRFQMTRGESGNLTVKGYKLPVEHFPFKIQSSAVDKEALKCFVDIFAK